MFTESAFPNSGAKFLQTGHRHARTDKKKNWESNFNACDGAFDVLLQDKQWCPSVLFTLPLGILSKCWNLSGIIAFVPLSL